MKAYLASPFFDGYEIAMVRDAKKVLMEKGLEVFMPMEHKIENDMELSNFEWGNGVFKMDKNAIHSCDIMVVLYFGLYSDTGTAWECGYAHALNIPVIVVNMGNALASLMIVNGCYACLTKEEFYNYNFEQMPVINFKGEQK